MNYLTFYAKDKSIRQVTVTSATEQSDEVYSAVRQLVAKAFDNSAEVEMTKKIDSDIIGGLIIQIDDKVYDASIKTQLKKVKEKLK
jgi:F-type H+-transporting ATPase subunit delta